MHHNSMRIANLKSFITDHLDCLNVEVGSDIKDSYIDCEAQNKGDYSKYGWIIKNKGNRDLIQHYKVHHSDYSQLIDNCAEALIYLTDINLGKATNVVRIVSEQEK